MELKVVYMIRLHLAHPDQDHVTEERGILGTSTQDIVVMCQPALRVESGA